MFITTSRSRDPILEKIGQSSRSYVHLIYTDEMCNNSITDGQINFILGG